MSNDFISIYAAMPPLNRLCECKFEHTTKIRKARLVYDIKNNRIEWMTPLPDGRGFGSLPPSVVEWRVIGTYEESIQWLQQLGNFNEQSAEERELSSSGNTSISSEVRCLIISPCSKGNWRSCRNEERQAGKQ